MVLRRQIMYQAYLSHEQIKEYLSVVIESELLNYDVYSEIQDYRKRSKVS
jgi:hypothetical protein